ncbi:hypothetical protein ACHAXA_011620 [Cyclostephanos tholiformis]|uniref:Uncharacterized protein n=1 Tax=Cyclostephanos tholiformis TaxID=382380 RepID=A0ABD3RV75_9STRA
MAFILYIMLKTMIPSSSVLRSLILPAPMRWHQCAAAAMSTKTVVRHFSSEDSSTSSEQRLHSTDIAFKPAESGWGGGGKYTMNFDSIFGSPSSSTSTTPSNETSKKKGETETAENEEARQNAEDDRK